MVISESQARAYAKQAGFRGQSLDIIVAIAHAESGLDTTPHDNVNDNGTHDRGILQINNYYHSEVSDDCAYDAACAFRAGYTISSRGNNFTPWTTYESGAYLPYMPGNSNPGGSADNAEAVRQSILPRYTWFSGYGEGRLGGRTHEGEDLGGSRGSKAYFPESGHIYLPGDVGRIDPLGGNVVYLSGDSGLFWYGAHFDNRNTFNDGQRVRKGDVWGRIDNTGDASTALPHIHYQVGPAGDWGNPATVLADGIPGTATGTGGGGGGIPGPASITIYNEPNYEGDSYTLTEDMPIATTGTFFPGHSRIQYIKSIRFHGSGCITVYRDINYQSDSKIFCDDVADTINELPWTNGSIPNDFKVISSIRLSSTPFPGGSGGGGIGISALINFPLLNSLAADVWTALSTIPGMYGPILAIDELEEIPGWIDHGSDPAGIIRSVSDSLFSNLTGLITRVMIMLIGFFLLIGLISNLVKSTTGVSTGDVIKVAAMAA